MTKHHKQKVRVIYRNVIEKKDKEVDLTPKIEKEIIKLKKQKAEIPKGLKGTIQRLQINKAIYDKGNYIRQRDNRENMKVANQNMNEIIEYEKKKMELKELRRKNAVSFEGLTGSAPQQRKELRFEDLF